MKRHRARYAGPACLVCPCWHASPPLLPCRSCPAVQPLPRCPVGTSIPSGTCHCHIPQPRPSLSSSAAEFEKKPCASSKHVESGCEFESGRTAEIQRRARVRTCGCAKAMSAMGSGSIGFGRFAGATGSSSIGFGRLAGAAGLGSIGFGRLAGSWRVHPRVWSFINWCLLSLCIRLCDLFSGIPENRSCCSNPLIKRTPGHQFALSYTGELK